MRWEPLTWISFESHANDQHPAGLLTISIEHPEPETPAIFLRFAYRTGLSETVGEDAKYADVITSYSIHYTKLYELDHSPESSS